MNHLKIFFFISILLLPAITHASDPKVAELSRQKLADLHEQPVQTTTLSNGIKLYYLQDTELPVANIRSYFRFGKINDPDSQIGIAQFLMQALRTAGSLKMPSDEVDDKLDFVAADISFAVESELSSLSLRCLQKDLPNVLPIYFDLIKEPAFEPEKLDIIKKELVNAINYRNEELLMIAVREFKQSLYGADSPYARLYNEQTISNITRDTLLEYYKKTVGPQTMVLAATSPLSFREFKKLIEEQIASWKTPAAVLAKLKPLEKKWDPSVEFIQKSGTQSAIAAGHFGDKRFNKDKFRLMLANEILGASSIGSKLGNRIRVDLGLAYKVQSFFELNTDFGFFVMLTQTKCSSTVQALEEMTSILSNMVQKKEISADELQGAKDRMLNRLVFDNETTFDVVNGRLRDDYFGYPKDYLFIRQKGIEKVTLDELKDVMAKYFEKWQK